jgi:hypothetical protein
MRRDKLAVYIWKPCKLYELSWKYKVKTTAKTSMHNFSFLKQKSVGSSNCEGDQINENKIS